MELTLRYTIKAIVNISVNEPESIAEMLDMIRDEYDGEATIEDVELIRGT